MVFFFMRYVEVEYFFEEDLCNLLLMEVGYDCV